MATERFINPHLPYKEGGEHRGHPSMASQARSLDTARQKIWEHEQEDLVYLEKRYGYVVGDQLVPFGSEEIEVFNSTCE